MGDFANPPVFVLNRYDNVIVGPHCQDSNTIETLMLVIPPRLKCLGCRIAADEYAAAHETDSRDWWDLCSMT